MTFWGGFALPDFMVPDHGFSSFSSTVFFGVFLLPTLRRRMGLKGKKWRGMVWWLVIERGRCRQTERQTDRETEERTQDMFN